MSEATEDNIQILKHTTTVAAAYLSKNPIAPDAIAGVLSAIAASLRSMVSGPAPVTQERPVPPVSIRRSVTPDYIVCLEDGKKLKMMKRHLRTVYGMSPDQYRAKWGLPSDYPMVAPSYAAQRSSFAKQIGLGKPSGAGRTGKPAAAAKPAPRGPKGTRA